MKKLILLMAIGEAAMVSSASAQMCSGSIPVLAENSVAFGNTCGSHLEIKYSCGITMNGKGVGIYQFRLGPDHSVIHLYGESLAFSPYVGVGQMLDAAACEVNSCYDHDHGEDGEDFPYNFTIPASAPKGIYYIVVGDYKSDETPGCGDFGVSTSGSYGMRDQYVHFTSARPTNAQTGGSYTVTAEASSGLSVYLDVDVVASDSLCEITGNSSGSVVNFTHPGKCVIRANQSGNEDYNPASQVIQSFDVSIGPPAQLEFDQNPSNGIAGVPLSSSVKVNELDSYRNLESGDSVSIISLIANGPGHLRGEPVTATLMNGVATFSDDLIFDTAGTYTLTASSNASGTSSVRSAQFSIMPSTVGAMLTFDSGLPSMIEQGQSLGSVTITETDQFGNRMTADNSTLVSLHANTCDGVSFGSAPLTAGQVSFDTTQVFHSQSNDVTLTADPTNGSGPVSATAHFGVMSSSDFVFFSGLEFCQP